MSRSVPEWIGRNDDEAVPTRVKVRVLERYERHCANCRREIRIGDRWICDHATALINGGENRENNLQPLCRICNPTKTRHDIAIKSETYATIKSHYVSRETRKRGNPIPGSKRSKWKKKMNGKVELRK